MGALKSSLSWFQNWIHHLGARIAERKMGSLKITGVVLKSAI